MGWQAHSAEGGLDAISLTTLRLHDPHDKEHGALCCCIGVCGCRGICERRRRPRGAPRGGSWPETAPLGSCRSDPRMGCGHRCAMADAFGSARCREEIGRQQWTSLASPPMYRHWHCRRSRSARRTRHAPAGIVDAGGTCCSNPQLRSIGRISYGRTLAHAELLSRLKRRHGTPTQTEPASTSGSCKGPQSRGASLNDN